MADSFRPQMSFATSKAIDIFRQGKPGDEKTREEMTEALNASCEIGGRGYCSINTAIRHCERVYAVVWRWSKDDKAWKCLGDKDTLEVGESYNKAIGRKSRRTLQVLSCVDEKQLSQDDRRDYKLATVAASLAAISVSAPLRKQLSVKRGPLVEPDYKQLADLVGSLENGDTTRRDGT